ncbi:ArsR/SmtB family transcription factor [Rhodanobacter glycinis]|uniref:DNA-binding transcriptional regulator, ArsR family n=1 Tax=Rhodanobacter glycinis TaxID=582702 RepID=A0A1I3XJ35_9GAMM|nr:metalloregulator ArsR/SmtB family transcription factor [Rhodanobacter glycinis]SFK19470.1 DNA-binding transcriptional regulator, ArsR family [Rhodanobacter glycinis]
MSSRTEPAPATRSRRTPVLQQHAAVFAALGDPTRLRLVAALCTGGALSIAQLTAGTAITRQAVTRHLQVLADVGLVQDARMGRERRWAFEPAPLEAARRSLEQVSRQWDQALERLRARVEA